MRAEEKLSRASGPCKRAEGVPIRYPGITPYCEGKSKEEGFVFLRAGRLKEAFKQPINISQSHPPPTGKMKGGNQRREKNISVHLRQEVSSMIKAEQRNS